MLNLLRHINGNTLECRVSTKNKPIESNVVMPDIFAMLSVFETDVARETIRTVINHTVGTIVRIITVGITTVGVTVSATATCLSA